jgi:hypothetical protein
MSLNADLDRVPDVWSHESYIKTSGWDACEGSQKDCQLEEMRRTLGEYINDSMFILLPRSTKNGEIQGIIELCE